LLPSVLLTDDGLLSEATQERFKERSNILVVRELEELKTMLNALASQLTQETVAEILPKATAMFFLPGDNQSLYYQWELAEKVKKQFSEVLLSKPEAGITSKAVKIEIGQPTFLSKKKQRLTFASRINWLMDGTKLIVRSPPNVPNVLEPMGATRTSQAVSTTGTVPPRGLLDFDAQPQVVQKGRHVFEATWSVTFTARGLLISPKLDKLEHHSSTWEKLE
jgi:hypothetical protein